MRAQSADQDEREELERYERELVDAIIARPPLRRIAQSPLLCALMCALYRDRNGQLPDDRMELYEVTLQVMLERRDLERGITPPVGLSRTEQSLILRDIAYWLVRNGRSDAERVRVLERISTMLVAMPQVRATVGEVFRHLLERSGLLREPIAGQVDFVHRTFQEYLAAKAAVDADDIGILVEHAHLDQWWEVIIMAAGHASRRQREELLIALVEEQIDDRRQRDWRDLLALACLETSPELDVDLRARIESRAGRLLPPRSMEVADSLSAGGEFALDLLARSHPRSAHEVAATIRAAARIGGVSALRLLARFSGDARPPVVEELVDAWSHFDPVEYAETVLHRLPWPEGSLNISDPALVAGLPALQGLRELDCRFSNGYGSVAFVRALPNLRALTLSDLDDVDLSPLADSGLERLSILRLGTEPLDLRQLVGARNLVRLNVHVPSRQWDAVRELPALRRIQLTAMPGADELDELRPLGRLTRLIVGEVSGRSDLAGLDFLTEPDTLGLIDWRDLVDLGGIERWADTLVNLWLRGGPLSDIDVLAQLPNLVTVDLSGTRVTDLSVLSTLRRLRRARLMRMETLPSLAPLRDLPELTSLFLQDSGDVDLTPLAGKEALTIYVTRRQTTTGAEWLGEGSKLERV
jgi:Leucine-rich repeat (LRR) protein